MTEARLRARVYRIAMVAWDVAAWFFGALLMLVARYETYFPSATLLRHIFFYAVIAAVLQVAVGFAAKLYRGRHPIGSFSEARSLGIITVIVGAVIGLAFVVFVSPFPRGIAIFVPPLAFLAMAAGRFLLRTFEDRTLERNGTNAERVLVYGAGNAGQQLWRLLRFDPDAPYEIVGFIDDDPDKRNLHLGSARVLGGRDQLVTAANKFGVSTVIMAVPTASREMLADVTDLVYDHGMKMLTLPPVHEIVGGKVDLATLHAVDTADLLGRTPVETNLSEIADYVAGRTVLVTGAGGSIGSEIVRQVHDFGAKKVVLVDHDESHLHETSLSVFGEGLLESDNIVLCDIRNRDSLAAVFAEHRPDVVFHVAALKHVPMLERFPLEAWRTNVLGTLNVLACADDADVSRFVNVSTDKAADPTTVLGKSKRIAEELTSWYGQHAKGTYLSVRFGNVLGSRGSVLHTFASQIEHGGPVQVTHPDAERYFMTVSEACQLVIQAGAIGDDGEVLVLDMGTPVNIHDVAKGLIKRSGQTIPIVFTGLREGEKLTEVLFAGEESPEPTSHELISRVDAPELDPALVEQYREHTITPYHVAQLAAGKATGNDPDAAAGE